MTHEEIWTEVTGYEGLYEVSSLSRVRSFRGTPKFLRPAKKDNSVELYNKYRKGKRFYVYRLAAREFLPNPDNLPHVKRVDNNVYNMKWYKHISTTGRPKKAVA